MKINIVLPGDLRAWIIEKAANRLAEHAGTCGVEVTISDRARPTADLNHWMSYAFANERRSTPATMLITHPDDPFKVSLIRATLNQRVDLGICMSSEIVSQLAAAGVPRTQLCYVLFGHDGTVVPRRITIGITTRLYADGRKREGFLSRLASDMDLSIFTFKIFGAGWGAIVEQLRHVGLDIEYESGSADYQADYRRIVDSIPSFDYYLYLGMDEGSLGTLDALAAGVGTIVTDQGFHKDIAAALTHRFVEYSDLLEIFRRIRSEHVGRIETAAKLTWNEYGRRHVLAWKFVLSGRRADVANELANEIAPDAARSAPSLRFRLRVFSPVRLFSAFAHAVALRPLANWIRELRRSL